MFKNQTKQTVDHYGLHQNQLDGVWWLLEQNNNSNAIGLPNKDCPFRIKSNLMMCPHKVDLSVPLGSLDKEKQVLENLFRASEIVSFFDPIKKPNVQCLYIETDNAQHYHTLTSLQNLCNITTVCSNMGLSIKQHPEIVRRRLRSSNLSSYVIYGVDSSSSKIIQDITTMSIGLPGRLVVAGPKLPMVSMGNMCKRVTLDTPTHRMVQEFGADKLKQLGALRIKEFMRN